MKRTSCLLLGLVVPLATACSSGSSTTNTDAGEKDAKVKVDAPAVKPDAQDASHSRASDAARDAAVDTWVSTNDSSTVDAPALEDAADAQLDAGPGDAAPEAATDATDAQTPDAPLDAADAAAPEMICDHPTAGFDPSAPGYKFFFDFDVSLLVGQEIGLAAGGFEPAAREDYCNPAPALSVPVGTCTDETPPTTSDQCSSTDMSNCAPEQTLCEANTDASGDAIPGTYHCTTPRSLMNVGPFTVTGFTTGPQTFVYTPSQQGAYMGTSDGTESRSAIAFDAGYTIAGKGNLPSDDAGASDAGSADAADSGATDGGDGAAPQGIGPFTGSYQMAPQFTVTSPALVQFPSGMSGFDIDTTQDFTFTWTGGPPGTSFTFTIAGGAAAHKTITCTAALDDGTFTVPAAMLQAAGLSTTALLNSMDVELHSTGTASGPGLSFTDIDIGQTFTVLLKKTK